MTGLKLRYNTKKGLIKMNEKTKIINTFKIWILGIIIMTVISLIIFFILRLRGQSFVSYNIVFLYGLFFTLIILSIINIILLILKRVNLVISLIIIMLTVVFYITNPTMKIIFSLIF